MKDKPASTKLKELIETTFSLNDLKDLCQDIGFDFERLPNIYGEKPRNVTALIKILDEEKKLPEFLELCQRKRPRHNWPEAPTKLYFEEDIQEGTNLQKALTKYKKYIRDKWEKDSLLGSPLADSYIPLRGQGATEKKSKDDDSAFDAVKDSFPKSTSANSDADIQEQQHQYKQELRISLDNPLPLDLVEALEKHQRLIISGAAGTGKSTFLRYLIHQKTVSNNGAVPIWANLSEYAEVIRGYAKAIKEGNPPPRPEPSLKQWAIETAHKDPSIQAILNSAVKENQVLWLLDGFDETGNQMNKVADAIAQLPTKNQLVLTSRPDALKGHQGRFNATQYILRNLRNRDVKKFLHKWFGDQDKESDILEWLAEDSHRQQLTFQPLHLILLATVTKNLKRAEWPETRVQLYGKFIDIFLDKRIKQKKDGNKIFHLGTLKRDEAYAAAIKGFHCLGWVLFHQEKELSNGITTLEKQVIDSLEQAGCSNEDAEAIFSFWQEAGVQKSFHQTIWSYAVASKLHCDWQKNAGNTWRVLSSATRNLPYASRLHHPDWREPILMLAGLMDEDELSALLNDLLDQSGREERYLNRNLFLAAAVLGERNATGRENRKLQEIKFLIVSKLKHLLMSRLPNLRYQTIKALGQTNTSEAQRTLIQILHYWPGTKEQLLAIEALSDSRDISIFPALVYAWQNSNVESELQAFVTEIAQDNYWRVAIIRALMSIDGKKALPIIANMVLQYGPEPLDRSFNILDASEFIKGYAPPSDSIGHPPLSMQERALVGAYRLMEKWDAMKKRFSSYSVTNQKNKPTGRVRGAKPINGGTARNQIYSYKWAINEIKQVRDRKLIPELEALFGHQLWKVQYAAAIALSHMGETSAIPHLVSAVERVDDEYHGEIKDGLVEIAKLDIAILAKHLGDDDKMRRLVDVLGSSNNPAAIPILENLLLKDDRYMSALAAQALGNFGEKAIKPLKDALQKCKEGDVRGATVKALGQIRDTTLHSVFLDSLNSAKHDSEREAAAEALEHFNDAETINLLIDTLKIPRRTKRSNGESMRITAAKTLGKIGDVHVAKILTEMLTTSQKRRQETAKIIQDRVHTISDLKHIRDDVLHDLEAVDDKSIIKALGDIGNEVAIPVLIQVLSEDHEELKELILKAYDAQRGFSAEFTSLQNMFWGFEARQEEAAIALGKIGNRQAVEPLMQVLQKHNHASGRFTLRNQAIQALAKIDDDRTTPYVIKAFHNGFDEREGLLDFLKQARPVISLPKLVALLDGIPDGAIDQTMEIFQEINKEAVEHLCQVYPRSNPESKYNILHVLGELRDKDALPVLLDATESSKELVRYGAVKALGKLDIFDKSGTQKLVEILNDKKRPDLHPHIVVALGFILDSTLDKSNLQKEVDLLESIRKALWQHRSASYGENVFVAYEKIVAWLTITQVRQLSQNGIRHF